MSGDRRTHWDSVYEGKPDGGVSWHQDFPTVSLELSELSGITAQSAVIDIGGGTSRFVDCLLDRGLEDLSVLDLSSAAIATSQARLGPRAAKARWIGADVTRWVPDQQYDLWHDRAVFHFLTDPDDRAVYLETLGGALRPGAHAIVATFALDGPERCSGLQVVRYSPESLAATLGDRFRLIRTRPHRHVTPRGAPQSFQFSLFRKE